MTRLFRWFGLPGRFVITVLLSCYAVTLAALRPSPQRLVAAAAMLMSSCGDIVLMDFKPITRHFLKTGFETGVFIFMLSHLLYTTAFGFAISIGGDAYINQGVMLAGIIFVIVELLMVAAAVGSKNAAAPPLLLGTLYLLVISLASSFVYSYAFSTGGRSILSAVGIFLFLLSDCFIIANRILAKKSKLLSRLVWWVYPAGQILLLSGI